MHKNRPEVLAFVMAGGEGTRLRPLTVDRCKPAIPFVGKHRLVDFVLSNLVNSGIHAIHVLVQYQSQSLIEHVRQAWTMARFPPHHFISIVPPQMRGEQQSFQGTADAVAQNLHLIEAHRPDLVAVFGADHVYRMDVGQMVDQHLAQHADVSIATVPVPLDQCASFGIVETDAHLNVTGFREKPAATAPMPGRKQHALASMGNYLFSADVLLEELRLAAQSNAHDFGHHVLPRMVGSRRVLAYDFTTNRVPGLSEFEEASYWRDVGTLDAYFDAHFDTLGVAPRFCMNNAEWPIYANPDASEPAQIENGVITRSVIGSECVVNGAALNHSVLRHAVRVDEDASIDHSILMEGTVVGRGARITRAIVDRDNHIPAGAVIGGNAERDSGRFPVSDNGVVVVPRGYFPRRTA